MGAVSGLASSTRAETYEAAHVVSTPVQSAIWPQDGYIVPAQSAAISCTLSEWVPQAAEKVAESTGVWPADLRTPWDLSAVSRRGSAFLSRLRADLDKLPTEASALQRSQVIFAAFLRLHWYPVKKNVDAPTPYDAATMLDHPRGNCANVTNLLYGLHEYFGVPCTVLHRRGAPGHLMLGVAGDAGELVGVDGTRGKEGFGVAVETAFLPLAEVPFAAKFFTSQGQAYTNGVSCDRDEWQAMSSYEDALYLCPEHTVARLNLALLYLDSCYDDATSWGEAEALMDSLDADGYVTGGTLYLHGLYESVVNNDTVATRRYFTQVIQTCADDYTYHQRAELWLTAHPV